MAVLASQGQPRRLGLINAPDAHSKNIVFVKLTDTSLEALTNYIKHANKVSFRSFEGQKPSKTSFFGWKMQLNWNSWNLGNSAIFDFWKFALKFDI